MVITLTGVNDFALQRELRQLMETFVKEFGDFAIERLAGDEVEFQNLYDALTSVPFLVDKKLVVLRNPSANKEFVEKAESLLKDVPETTDVILVEPKLDKRLSYYKFLTKATDFREFNELDINGLVNWLVNEAKSRKGSLSASEARYLVNRIGANQQLLAAELEKLLLYDPKITRETIDMLTERAPQSTVFELLDAAFAGNAKRALDLYAEQRAMKVEPQQITAMLAWQLHVLAVIKTAGSRSPEEIAREAKLNPYVVRKSLAIAREISLSNLKSHISNLLDLDVRLKSEPINADEALQLFLLNL